MRSRSSNSGHINEHLVIPPLIVEYSVEKEQTSKNLDSGLGSVTFFLPT